VFVCNYNRLATASPGELFTAGCATVTRQANGVKSIRNAHGGDQDECKSESVRPSADRKEKLQI
jgi:hypothetical protein